MLMRNTINDSLWTWILRCWVLSAFNHLATLQYLMALETSHFFHEGSSPSIWLHWILWSLQLHELFTENFDLSVYTSMAFAKQPNVLLLNLNFIRRLQSPSPFELFKSTIPPNLFLATQASKGFLHVLLATIYQILLGILSFNSVYSRQQQPFPFEP